MAEPPMNGTAARLQMVNERRRLGEAITGAKPVLFLFRGKRNMAMQTTLEALIEAAKHLSDDDRRKLVEALNPSSASPQPRDITEMRGLGKDLWQEVDPQEFLNAERDSWEN